MEKLEGYLNRSFEQSLRSPHGKPLQAVLLLPKPVPPHIRFRIDQYLWGVLGFFAALVLFSLLGLMVCFVYMTLDMFTLHQIQRHWRAILRVTYAATKRPLFILCLIPFVVAPLFAAFQYPMIWAWNRRADRLNREMDAPQALLAIDTSVWPPPPTVSAPADTLPRI